MHMHVLTEITQALADKYLDYLHCSFSENTLNSEHFQNQSSFHALYALDRNSTKMLKSPVSEVLKAICTHS